MTPTRQHRKRRTRFGYPWSKWLGMGSILAGLILLGRIGWFYTHSYINGQSLLQHDEQLTHSRSGKTVHATHIVYPAMSTPRHTNLGILHISSIHLTAPVLQGTHDAEINSAVGHLSASVFPGERGTSILAGHNVTWFHRINAIPLGGIIAYTTSSGTWTFRVVRHQVVHVGTPVPNSPIPHLVLEACYPLNALYLTPYRYLVTAVLVKSPQPPRETHLYGSTTYHIAIPAVIRRQGVTLASNYAPMGTLQITGHPSTTWRQSNAPLNLASAITSGYFAILHIAKDDNPSAWAQFAPHIPWSALKPLATYQSLSYVSPLDETIRVVRRPHIAVSATINTVVLVNSTQRLSISSVWGVTNHGRVFPQSLTLTQ